MGPLNLPTRARSKVDAAQSLLATRRALLAVLEQFARFTRAVDADLAYQWRLYRMAERRAFEVTGR